jgi:two-component system sensor histidine kinase UhpB
MQDINKTEEELAIEVARLRQRVAELEKKEMALEKEAILNTLVEHVIHEDREMKILWANRTACDSASMPREELIGRHCYEIWPKRSDPCPDCPVVKAMETGQLQEVEKMTSDGRSWFIRGYPLRDEKDNIIGGIEFTLEITERKQAEKKLRESEERFRRVVETMKVGLGAIDENGVLTYVNEYLAKMLGYSVDEMIGRPTLDFYYDEESRKAQGEIFAKRRSGMRDPTPYEVTWRRKDGQKVYAILSPTPVFDADGRYMGSFAIHTDITERKQMEDDLRESEERFRALFESAPDAIFLADPESEKILDANPAASRLLLRPHEEIVGLHQSQLHPPQKNEYARKKFVEHIQEAQHEKKTHPIESAVIRSDGYEVPVEVLAQMVYIHGRPVLQGTFRDITERKQAAEALRDSEERYRRLVEDSLLGIGISSGNQVVFANPALLRLFGYDDLEEFTKIPLLNHVAPASRELIAARMEKLAQGKPIPAEFEYDILRKDKLTRTLLASTSHFTSGGKTYSQTTFQDITERKQSEEALKKSEEKYRLLSENIPVAVYSALPDEYSTNLFLSGQFLELTRYPIEYFLKDPLLWDTILHPADKDYVWEKIKEHRREKALLEVEYRIITKDKIIKWIRDRARPVLDEHGEILRIDGFMEDVTERKQAEIALRESEEEYRSLVESSEDSIYLIDSHCNYLFVNSKYLSRLGLRSSHVIGKAYSKFHSPEETKDFVQRVNKVLKTGTSFSYEYRSLRDNRYFIRTLSPVKPPEGGKVNAITVISKDITELKMAEAALREREAFNFALFHYNPVETIVVDLDGRVIGFNQTKKQSGDRLPTIGDMMYEDYAGKHEIDMRAELMECITSGKAKEFPDRRYGNKYLSITISPFSKGALIISEDITKRKHAEDLLLKERDTFFSILQRAPYGVMVINDQGRHTFINPEFTTITGYTLEDVPTDGDWLRLAYPDRRYRNMVIETWNKDFTQGELTEQFSKKFSRVFSRAFRVVCKDGATKEIEFRRVETGDEGNIVMLSDITERKKMHELMETAATEWRTTFDAINDAVFLFDQEGRIKRCNNAMLLMIGKPFGEIIGRRCWEVLHGVSEPPERCALTRVHKSRHRETEALLRDNRWFNVSIDPLQNQEGDFLGGVHIMTDITEQKRSEEALQQSEERFRNVVETMKVGLSTVNEKGVLTYANEYYCNMLGYSMDEIIGRSTPDFLYYEGGRKAQEDIFAKRRMGMHDSTPYEITCRKKDGRKVYAIVSPTPQFDENGRYIGSFAIQTDITEHKQVEEELHSSREQLRDLTSYLQSVREEERTNIAREIHDELAQVLTALKMDVSWLDNRLPRDQMPLIEKTRSMSDLINTTIQTVKRISAELRPGILDDLGLVAAIEWQAEEFQHRTGIVCRVIIDPEELTVEKDRSTAIFRIFQETLTNVSRHAGASRVTVRLREKNGMLSLMVRDNGKGITKKQILDSKSFGLIGMRERVHPWGGAVDIKGIPGKGTTVLVDVPARSVKS